ncbi:MAG: cyclopropane fatty acyl phospholipid synthase [Ilumatobacteraceae bacterium]
MIASTLRGRFERLMEPADVRVDGDRPWDVRIHDERLFARVLATGTLGFGDAYMDGWWSCGAIDELVCRSARHRVVGRLGAPIDLLQAGRAHVVNLQTRVRSTRVAHTHYDLGNDLYERMLDPTMMYSCGYWANATTLDEAQTAKLDLIARKLGLEPGMRVVDIGCGWGGAARHFADQYGCEVVGLTISVEQAALAQHRCTDLPVEIRVQDYRDLDERFDRVVSIGMFEHVGHKNHASFMETARRSLADPDGLMLLHTIGKLDASTRVDPWIAAHIFPNSFIPGASHVTTAAEHARLVLEDWHSFGPDYDPTLMAWHRNVEAAWDQLDPRYDERFRRMWRFYLLASAGAFRARTNQLWQLVYSRDGLQNSYRPAGIR